MNFAALVPSDDGLETHASWPLFRHSDVTAQLITEQNMFMNDPGFQDEC